MRWPSRWLVRAKAVVRSKGWWVLAMLGGMVLIVAYGLYAWYRPHWPGEPADPEELESILAGQATTYWWDLTCSSGETCIWYYHCRSAADVGKPCTFDGTWCEGWNNGYCTNPPGSGYWCVQRRWDDMCCYADGTCQLTFAGTVSCEPPSPGRKGQWRECWYDITKPLPPPTAAQASP